MNFGVEQPWLGLDDLLRDVYDGGESACKWTNDGRYMLLSFGGNRYSCIGQTSALARCLAIQRLSAGEVSYTWLQTIKTIDVTWYAYRPADVRPKPDEGSVKRKYRSLTARRPTWSKRSIPWVRGQTP